MKENNMQKVWAAIHRIKRNHDLDLTVEHSNGGHRLETLLNGRPLGPRLQPVELALWVDGFEFGLDEAARKK